jgi:hypothetical protein
MTLGKKNITPWTLRCILFMLISNMLKCKINVHLQVGKIRYCYFFKLLLKGCQVDNGKLEEIQRNFFFLFHFLFCFSYASHPTFNKCCFVLAVLFCSRRKCFQYADLHLWTSTIAPSQRHQHQLGHSFSPIWLHF